MLETPRRTTPTLHGLRHAAEAAKYPKGLCRAVNHGISQQLREDKLLKDGCLRVQAPDDDAAIERLLRGPDQGYSGRFRDDLTCEVLKDEFAQEARAKELEFFHSKRVWQKRQKSFTKLRTGCPPISVRWVDVNKGDDMSPNYWSILVARQLKARDTSGKCYFL